MMRPLIPRLVMNDYVVTPQRRKKKEDEFSGAATSVSGENELRVSDDTLRHDYINNVENVKLSSSAYMLSAWICLSMAFAVLVLFFIDTLTSIIDYLRTHHTFSHYRKICTSSKQNCVELGNNEEHGELSLEEVIDVVKQLEEDAADTGFIPSLILYSDDSEATDNHRIKDRVCIRMEKVGDFDV